MQLRYIAFQRPVQFVHGWRGSKFSSQRYHTGWRPPAPVPNLALLQRPHRPKASCEVMLRKGERTQGFICQKVSVANMSA